MKNRIISILLALVLLFALAVNASADNSMPDLTQKGSLTFIMELGGEPVNKGKLNLYHVAGIEMVKEDVYDFRLFDTLNGDELSLENINDPDLAAELLRRAKEAQLEPITASIEAGLVEFKDLPTGLYLVWQAEEDVDQTLSPIQPFVISVPKWMNGSYDLEVLAVPKVPIETEPTEPPPPPPPPPPDLPQTGQLNWPVPVMAIAGVVLLVLGWCLCLRGKRLENEE